jgi:hypothetical protein
VNRGLTVIVINESMTLRLSPFTSCPNPNKLTSKSRDDIIARILSWMAMFCKRTFKLMKSVSPNNLAPLNTSRNETPPRHEAKGQFPGKQQALLVSVEEWRGQFQRCQELVTVARHKVPASTGFELGTIYTVSLSSPPQEQILSCFEGRTLTASAL